MQVPRGLAEQICKNRLRRPNRLVGVLHAGAYIIYLCELDSTTNQVYPLRWLGNLIQVIVAYSLH